jgi:hypothetical protein
MKKITENTILKQGEKEFKAVQFADNICWYSSDQIKPIAQSELALEGVSTINLEEIWAKHWEKTNFELQSSGGVNPHAYRLGFLGNPNQYTQADIEKAMDLMYRARGEENSRINNYLKSWEETFDEINQIQSITVDQDFNILSYE